MNTQSVIQPRAAGEAAHTPGTATPWTLKHKTTIERGIMLREHVAICPNGGPSIAYLPAGRDSRVDLQLANAAFIVRACNSHAALVQTAKLALQYAERCYGGDHELATTARAALAVAKS